MHAFKSAAGCCESSRSGETHYTASDVEHWHGATPDSEFTQVALGRGDAAETVWLDKVTDERVRGALATATGRCTPRR